MNTTAIGLELVGSFWPPNKALCTRKGGFSSGPCAATVSSTCRGLESYQICLITVVRVLILVVYAHWLGANMVELQTLFGNSAFDSIATTAHQLRATLAWMAQASLV